jgi:hypothetical protein
LVKSKMMRDSFGLSRRGLLTGGLGLGLASGAWPVQAASSRLTGAGRGPRPGAVGHKFNADGSVRPFAGSTLICHLDPAAPIHRVLSRVRAEAQAAPYMRKFTLLPASSLHMTVLPGVDDEHRQPPLWPDVVAADAPIEACNAWCADQLRGLRTGVRELHMRPASIREAEEPTDFTVLLEAASSAEEQRLRRLRDQLSSALHIRARGHETYRFHITLGYQIDWLTADEAEAFVAAHARWMAQIRAVAPTFPLGPPEFCTFKDMFAFERQFYLAP